MSEEIKKKMLLVSAILFKHNVPVDEAKLIGSFIEELQAKNQQLNEAIDEVRKYIKSESPDAGVSGKAILNILNTEIL